jgi:hypothetical protein
MNQDSMWAGRRFPTIWVLTSSPGTYETHCYKGSMRRGEGSKCGRILGGKKWFRGGHSYWGIKSHCRCLDRVGMVGRWVMTSTKKALGIWGNYWPALHSIMKRDYKIKSVWGNWVKASHTTLLMLLTMGLFKAVSSLIHNVKNLK